MAQPLRFGEIGFASAQSFWPAVTDSWWVLSQTAIPQMLDFTLETPDGFVASIRRRVLRQQKQLELLRQDVAALRLAEEKRFLKELNRPRTNALGQYPVLTKAPKIAARS